MNTVKKGRPVKNGNVTFKIKTTKMNSLNFSSELFKPMVTKTKLDEFFSSEGGLMRGTNYVGTGDPGVGKSTVLLDMLANLQASGAKCLFISGEMNAIDLYGYVKRYPKFGDLEILFMSDYSEVNPDLVLRETLKSGYDVVLVDSMAEISDVYTEYFGGTNKSNQTRLLQLFEEHNLGKNESHKNTSFLIIQQVTKSGMFVGSNKLKHMTTGMFAMKHTPEGERYLMFSKNRRGGNMNKLYFNLTTHNRVEYLRDEAPNAE
jgi:predicted ATP-dependent serine protease